MGAIKEKKPAAWPVIEIFGPTIQGEGVDQGVVAHFVRFGGCDFRCTWCDTPYAVLPNEVRENARRMGADAVTQELVLLGPKVPWIVLTGGNPGLLDLRELVDQLHKDGYLVAVETQGSRWREWMRDVDRLCVSPKPPSAEHRYDWTTVQRFLEEGLRARAQGERAYEWMFLKVPVFSDADLDWCERLRSQLSDALLYLSAGNDAGRTVGNPDRQDTRTLAEIRGDLCDRYEWLVNEVFKRSALCAPDVLIQAQGHVLIWGNAQGR